MKMQLTLQTHNVRDVRSLPTSFLQIEPDLSRLHRLTEADRTEVLEFLSIRPVHTVVMASFIADNGIDYDQRSFVPLVTGHCNQALYCKRVGTGYQVPEVL